MRLSETEVECLVDVVQSRLPMDFKGALILFGSQVDHSARGGDIDIVLVVESAHHLQELKLIDYKMVAAMKMAKEIGDRKIDFKVISRQDTARGFYAEALRKSETLRRWVRAVSQ